MNFASISMFVRFEKGPVRKMGLVDNATFQDGRYSNKLSAQRGFVRSMSVSRPEGSKYMVIMKT